MSQLRALVANWLLLDFFGDARRHGGNGSTLTTTIFTQSFLAFVVAALLYPETPPVPFAAANLCLSTLLVAIGALGEPEPANRQRADAVLLGTAPLPRAVLALARAAHGVFHLGLVTLGMALPPAILLGFLTGSLWRTAAYLVLAVVCSGLAAGSLAVALRAAARGLGTLRAELLAGTAKALLLGGGVVLFALGMQRLQQNADALPLGRTGANWLWPYHAAQWLATPEAVWRLLPLAATAAVLWLAATALGEPADTGRRVRARHSVLQQLLVRLAGHGPRLAVAAFTATAMWRSPGFRARVLPLLGLPAGMAFLSLRGQPEGAGSVALSVLLQLPAIYLPFLIAFLPRADQPEAAWVFEQSPHLSPALVRDAVWRALVSHVLVPVHAAAALWLLAMGPGRSDALAASAFALGLGILIVPAMLRPIDGVPFTQARAEDTTLDLGGLFAFALLLGAAGAAFGLWLPGGWPRWAVAAVALTGAGFRLAARRPGPAPLRPAATGTPEPQPELDQAPTQTDPAPVDPASAARTGLQRELRAIATLYLACSILPTLVGWAMRQAPN
ncbi:MAG: hypothetical protein JNK49_16265 [Planctomycetes bacterium]|nr:hypothetical protein [Planctomycetota bacterium]